MQAVGAVSANGATVRPAHEKSAPEKSVPEKSASDTAAVRKVFQKFVAGTFYKEMMKSMRKLHDKPAYFHGGQAEEMFQSQMDQQVAEDLAEKHGGPLSEQLFQSFTTNLRARQFQRQTAEQQGTPPPPAQPSLHQLQTAMQSTDTGIEARLSSSTL